jgi:DNA-binding transcriptional regulator GbsR (MarR family)
MPSENEDRITEFLRFADEVGLFYEDLGYPRIWGQTIGWLMVCEPRDQSAKDLATVLRVSRDTMGSTIRSLIRGGLVARRTRAGENRAYYWINPGAWSAIFEQQHQSAKRLHGIAEQGLALLDGESPERRQRLEELENLAVFYEQESQALIKRWCEWSRNR